MTDLMKRYEKYIGQRVNWSANPIGYTKWLEAQLTWRPVSEKPEKDGEYFAKHDTSDEPSVLSYKDGVWLFFDYDIAENVITNPPLYWLPIPPAPKGEVK
jgi:hypothetical protein